MSMRKSDGDFFKSQWDKLAAAGGILVLALVVVMKFVITSEEEFDYQGSSSTAQEAKDDFDASLFKAVFDKAGVPVPVQKVPNDKQSFLASEMRVSCSAPEGSAKPGCGRPIPYSDTNCRYCGAKQTSEIKVVVDADGDGLTDEYEKKFGLNPAVADADADKDSDGFTNIEEFLAKTDPSDGKSHPDYMDSLVLRLPLKQEYTRLQFVKAYKVGDKLRYNFKEPGRDNEYDRGNYFALEGEEIGKTGFVVKGVEHKFRSVKMPGGMTRKVEADEATLERKSDRKIIKLVMGVKSTPTDVQATLSLDRAGGAEYKVVEGQRINIKGVSYKVQKIEGGKKAATVVVANEATGRVRAIEALEQ